MAAAAAAGSAALVIGRPTTTKSAPAAAISSGVAVRAWSSAALPAGRDAARVALKERPAQRIFQIAQAMPAEQPTLRLVWRAAV